MAMGLDAGRAVKKSLPRSHVLLRPEDSTRSLLRPEGSTRSRQACLHMRPRDDDRQRKKSDRRDTAGACFAPTIRGICDAGATAVVAAQERRASSVDSESVTALHLPVDSAFSLIAAAPPAAPPPSYRVFLSRAFCSHGSRSARDKRCRPGCRSSHARAAPLLPLPGGLGGHISVYESDAHRIKSACCGGSAAVDHPDPRARSFL